MCKDKCITSSSELENVLYLYQNISKVIKKVLTKTYSDNYLHGFQDLDIICDEAMIILKTSISWFYHNKKTKNVKLVIMCSYMLAHKLHNDDSHCLSYQLVKQLLGYECILDWFVISNLEIEMCSLIKYIKP